MATQCWCQELLGEAGAEKDKGVHPRLTLSRLHLRIGSRFISVWWLLAALVLGAGLFILA